MRVGPIETSLDAIQHFCRKWNIAEFSLFGSILREDFGPDSDVDVLIHLVPGVEMTLENWISMREELSALFDGRKIDLVERALVRNPFRRHEILNNRRIVYAA
jgi:predicted nucleotidyltransferase